MNNLKIGMVLIPKAEYFETLSKCLHKTRHVVNQNDIDNQAEIGDMWKVEENLEDLIYEAQQRLHWFVYGIGIHCLTPELFSKISTERLCELYYQPLEEHSIVEWGYDEDEELWENDMINLKVFLGKMKIK